MNNKIFISGRITGDPNYPLKFEAAEAKVLQPGFFDRHGVDAASRLGIFGFKPVSPVDLTFLDMPVRDFPWWVCMVVCLWHLLGCSYVYMLYDWPKSRGARIEHKVARFFRKHIIYQ